MSYVKFKMIKNRSTIVNTKFIGPSSFKISNTHILTMCHTGGNDLTNPYKELNCTRSRHLCVEVIYR